MREDLRHQPVRGSFPSEGWCSEVTTLGSIEMCILLLLLLLHHCLWPAVCGDRGMCLTVCPESLCESGMPGDLRAQQNISPLYTLYDLAFEVIYFHSKLSTTM